MKIGIVGLSGSGKSTLYRALGGSSGEVCTIKSPDERVDALAKLSGSKKRTYVEVSFVSSSGGSNFQALQADALVVVLRGFDSSTPASPATEWKEWESELILTDMELLENRISRLHKEHKPEQKSELELLQQCLAHLENGKRLISFSRDKQAQRILSGYSLLSAKPVLPLLNLDENRFTAQERSLQQSLQQSLQSLQTAPECQPMSLCAQLEMEISQLSAEEQPEFLASLNLEKPVRERFIQAAFGMLDLICFLTTGPEESRAWSISSGSSAQQAAGKIHSDIARGFIRAAVIPYQQLLEIGSEKEARQQGKIRLEGKQYVVQNGDVIHFRFAT